MKSCSLSSSQHGEPADYDGAPNLGADMLSDIGQAIIPGHEESEEMRLMLLVLEEATWRKGMENKPAPILKDSERNNGALASFAQMISHDLKAPLRGIATLAGWIAADQMDRLDGEGRKHLDLLIRRVRRLDAFIDGLLDWARVEQIAAVPAPVDLNVLVREVIESLMPPPYIAITVAERLPMPCIEWVRAQQIFQNLVANAIRFMDKPYGRVEIACLVEGSVWQFSVSDNGPGIDPRHFQRIFELFQTLNSRDRVESTGIGLAIVKKIVEGYGGRIWVESTLGQGSTFFFTLPRSLAGRLAIDT
jgi:two-component system sensor kinase FixL